MNFKHTVLAVSIFIAAVAVSGCGQSFSTLDASGQDLSSDVVPSGPSTEVAGTDTVVTPENPGTTTPDPTTPPAQDPMDPNDPNDPSTPPLNVCGPQNPPPCIIVDPVPPTHPGFDRGEVVVSGVFEQAETAEPVLGDLDNLRIDIMVSDFSDAGADRLGAVFCPTSDFDGTDCIRLRLEQSGKSFGRGQLVTYLLAPYSMDPDAGIATQTNRLGVLNIRDLAYFRLHSLGVDDTAFVSGVALSVQPKGTNFFVPIYRNPCVNRWIERRENTDRQNNTTTYDYTSDHSLEGDEAICIYAKVADREDAGSDDRVSVEIPLSKAPEAATLGYLKEHQAGRDMPVQYREDSRMDRIYMTSDLQYDRVGSGDYDDFQRGHGTSYGFTVYQSNGSLKDTFNLRVHSGDWLKLERFDIYRIQPGSKAFLKDKKCASFFSTNMAPDGIPNLSTDSDEAVTPNWSEFDHQGMAANNVCSQFGTIQPGPDTTAFGVK